MIHKMLRVFPGPQWLKAKVATVCDGWDKSKFNLKGKERLPWLYSKRGRCLSLYILPLFTWPWHGLGQEDTNLCFMNTVALSNLISIF